MFTPSLKTGHTTQQRPNTNLRVVRSTRKTNTQSPRATYQQELAFYQALESVAVLSNN